MELNEKMSFHKSTLAIHDLSCFGKCALTLVLPVLSAMGIQTVPIPTALLSTHTGGFDGFFFEDLTCEMGKISSHLKSLDIHFDAVYTGFLGSSDQIKTVSNIIDDFGKENSQGGKPVILVDPVMGDDGKLYSTYTEEMIMGVRDLCKKADIITPNITEGCFLTQTDFKETSKMSESEVCDFAMDICEKLGKITNARIALTGLHYDNDKFATFGFSKSEGVFLCSDYYVEKSYPGTGDLFASVLLGELLRGEKFKKSVKKASEFTRKVIDYSSKFDYETRNGVLFENFLKEL